MKPAWYQIVCFLVTNYSGGWTEIACSFLFEEVHMFTHNECAHRYFYSKCVLLYRQVESVTPLINQVCLLVPGGLAYPTEGESCICANLDGSCFCFSDSLLHRLHKILGVVDQHLCGLVKETFGSEAVRGERTT